MPQSTGGGSPRQDKIDGMPQRRNMPSKTSRPQSPLDGLPMPSGMPHVPNREGFKGRPRID
jgi:hypothetical protein